MTRLSSLAQEWFIEKSDPLHPQLFQSQTEYRKLLVDNPDVRYGFCALDETQSYRLKGTRGQAAYIGLTFGTPVRQRAGGRPYRYNRSGALGRVRSRAEWRGGHPLRS